MDENRKGVSGIPVKRCTMALKFAVSVLKSVVVDLLEALDRFLPTWAVPVTLTDKLAEGRRSSVIATGVVSG